MVSPHQLHRPRPLHQDPTEDSIYEHLPGEPGTAQAESMKGAAAFQHGLPPSLVRQPRGRSKHVHTFGAGLVEPEDDAEEEPSSFFTPAFESGTHEEQLVKPSQLKQRRRLNCKFH